MTHKIKNYINAHQDAINLLNDNIEVIEKICEKVIFSLNNGGKLFFMGNGGSAADAQHLAAEFVGRFRRERKPLAAIALTTDTSILTAIGNDYGYDQVFRRQIEALATSNDIVFGLSTSGNSANVIEGIKAAKSKNITTVGFLGKDGGALKNMVDMDMLIPLNETSYVQEMHILAGHIICEIVESELFDDKL
ncbi:MAG: D-sedoheptulose 7-phosphate isomerase [Candidatus Omnitrophica bacterium]|nr:D-sedoheptulose 7-phosphate isomerase [Candidatus Omnitrophota bacterium]MDD5081245.1 D-sedoheptulose 7-phosphate isomerase [Candidatus Omnitrophota bacterium]MDD5441316.1 D-sedoheptulose 7-phosphate isomerase [Candidatus Omnitrophota bacterium]